MTKKNTTRAELAANIKRHRWLVFKIMEGNETEPPFAYTVGLFKTFGHPEVVISGLDNDLAHAILNDIGSDIAKGLIREPGVLYEDILEDYSCLFKPVPSSLYESYFGRALAFYEGTGFPVLQCLWPNALQRFPGDSGYAGTTQEALFEH